MTTAVLRRLQAARHRDQHLRRDDAPGQRARRDQPVAGVPGLRLRPGAGRGGRRARCAPGTTSTRRCPACWRCARRSPPRCKPVTAPRTIPRPRWWSPRAPPPALYATLTAFVHPGDEVLLFEPCYDSYVPVIRLSGGTPVFVSLRYPGLPVDWDEVRARHHAADPADPGEHAAQPDRHRVDGGRHGAQLAPIVDGTHIADRLRRGVRAHHLRRPAAREPAALPGPALARGGHQLVRQDVPHDGLEGRLCRGAAAADGRGACASTSSSPSPCTRRRRSRLRSSSRATRRRTRCRRSTRQKRDGSSTLTAGSRFTPLACEGTYFQLIDYSAISTDGDRAWRSGCSRRTAWPRSRCRRSSTRTPAGRCCASASRRKTRRSTAAAERLKRV